MSTNMELITSVTVGSGGAASVTLPATGTIPATYTDLRLVVSARTNRADTFDCLLVKPNNSSSNLTYRYIRGDGTTASSNTLSRFDINGNNATASTFGNLDLYIPNYAGSNFKSMSGDSVTENNATEALSGLHAWLWSDTSAITTLVCAPQFGTLFLEGSTFYLYGISNVTSTTKATGGIVSSDGTYNYHMFPFSGTFTPTQNISVDYLVIAGGGGGAGNQGGGGGAGGLRSTVGATGGGGSLESALSLTANTGYTVTIGAGGSGTWGSITNGSNSVFSTITSTGGGKGGNGGVNGSSGGSGGGGGYAGSGTAGTGGAGTANQGYAGGDGVLNQYGGSGGGAGGAGTTGNNASITGGAGVQITAFANATQTGVNSGFYAIGGNNNGSGNGTVNTGNGAQANQNNGANNGGAGGSGLVIIRYAI